MLAFRMSAVLYAVITLSATASASLAQVLSCDVTLLRHQESGSVRKATHIFFLDLVTQDNYSQMQEAFKGSWDGPWGFKSDFSHFKEQRDQYRKEVRYEKDEKDSRDYAISTLTPTGLEAYKACLETQTPQNSVSLALLPESSVDRQITLGTIVKSEFDLAGKRHSQNS